MSKKLEMIQLITRKMADTFRNLHAMCLKKLQELDQLEKHQLLDQSDPQDSVLVKKKVQRQQNDTQRSKEEDNQPKKKKKPSRNTDPNKPKQPSSDQRQFISKNCPQKTYAEITKIASKCWKDLSEAQKQPYNKRYNQQKRKYDQQMSKYRLTHPEQMKIKKEQKEGKKNQEKCQKNKSENNSGKGSEKIQQQQSEENDQIPLVDAENIQLEEIKQNTSKSDEVGKFLT